MNHCMLPAWWIMRDMDYEFFQGYVLLSQSQEHAHEALVW
jgi:hypothetical protein